MLLNFHFPVVLVLIFFSNEKLFKITSKVDSNAADVPMGINININEPV